MADGGIARGTVNTPSARPFAFHAMLVMLELAQRVDLGIHLENLNLVP